MLRMLQSDNRICRCLGAGSSSSCLRAMENAPFFMLWTTRNIETDIEYVKGQLKADMPV